MIKAWVYGAILHESKPYAILSRLRANTSSIPSFGAVAQLGARLNGIQKVSGSNPLSSTKRKPRKTRFFLLSREGLRSNLARGSEWIENF